MDLSPSPVTFWNQPYALTTLVTCILAALLGILVLWKQPKSPAARMWAVMCFCVAGWAFWFTRSLLAQTANDSLWNLRTADGVGLFIPITFLHFVMHFIGKTNAKLLKAGYAVSALIASTVYTDWFTRGAQWKFGMWWEIGGPGLFLFAMLFVFLSGYGILLLLRAARQSKGIQKAQLSCLVFATLLGFGGGFMWFPPAFGIDIPPLGGHAVAFYCVIVMYAIVRYRFLDIQIVIRRSLVYSILVTLLTVGYFGAIYLIEQIFQAKLGYRSPVVSVTAFALMALAFQPLKIQIQHLVDWLIFRMPQEELVRRMERLEEQALQAEKFKAVSTLAAGMAHEIKNPLTALKTFGEFLPEKRNDPAFLDKLQEILGSETHRIQTIVQDLLDFAKPKPPQLKPVEIGSLITSTVNFLSADLAKHRIDCKINCSHNGATTQADADQLRQVLINLIQNAADAMPNGGTLTIATQANNGHLEIAISDTGHGIPKELLPKIFDPFITTKERGTGLGLAMVYAIVQAHHGVIRAESTPGRGAIFTLRLPL